MNFTNFIIVIVLAWLAACGLWLWKISWTKESHVFFKLIDRHGSMRNANTIPLKKYGGHGNNGFMGVAQKVTQ